MIRKLQEKDIDIVMEIWLTANIEAHQFISPHYWYDSFKLVKEMIVQAEVYVYEINSNIYGFIGLNNDYIAGIFVCNQKRSMGIGKQLLDYVKEIKQQLKLNVYQKNTKAVNFYQRENFKIQNSCTDTATGEKEYTMIWKNRIF